MSWKINTDQGIHSVMGATAQLQKMLKYSFTLSPFLNLNLKSSPYEIIFLPSLY